VARFLNAADPAEVVWTRGTTDAINLVAAAWGRATLKRGDEILTTVAEHYSNLLPWQHVARETGATLRHLDVDDDGRLRLDDLDRLLTRRTRLVAFSHVSNVLGVIVDAPQICRRAHDAGAVVLIDGAQSAPHVAIDVQRLECDFFACSSHKMFGPMGMGVLWGRRSLLERLPPYQTGANMAHDADLASARYAALPFKYQAGSANVAGPVGLAAAIQFMQRANREGLEVYEKALARHLLGRLAAIRRVRVVGSLRDENRIPLVTFSVDGVPAPDIVMALDARGIAVRGGDMAALPLLKRLGRTAAVRVSLSVYNTTGEIDRFADTLEAFLQTRARH
jgi:cysteine desulfurase/selenocysteine lyase